MPKNQQRIEKAITEYLTSFYSKAKNELITIRYAEKISADLFSIIFSSHFSLARPNNPGYDAATTGLEILLQVSCTDDFTKKVKEDLPKINNLNNENIKRVIFFFISYKSKATIRIKGDKYFNPANDIWTLKDIVTHISENTELKYKVYKYLEFHFSNTQLQNLKEIVSFERLLNGAGTERSIYGFPVGSDFDMMWTFQSTEHRIIDTLNRNKRLILTAPYNRGKTSIIRSIARKYFENDYTVLILNLVENKETLTSAILEIKEFLNEFVNYFLIFENCHANQGLFHQCLSLASDASSINPRNLSVFTTRFPVDEKKYSCMQINIEIGTAELKSALSSVGISEKRIINAIQLLGKESINLQLLVQYFKFENLNAVTFTELAEYYRHRLDETITETLKQHRIPISIGTTLKYVEDLARLNSNDEHFVPYEDEALIMQFELLSSAGTFMQHNNAFRFPTETDAKFYYYGSQINKAEIDKIARDRINSFFRPLIQGEITKHNYFVTLLDLVKNKMPDSNSFELSFFQNFDQLLSNNRKIAEKLYDENLGFLLYHHLFKYKANTFNQMIFEREFSALLQRSRKTVTEAHPLTLEHLAIFSGSYSKERNRLFDLIGFNKSEVESILHKITRRKSFSQLLRFFSRSSEFKKQLIERFPPKRVDALIGKKTNEFYQNVCLINNDNISGFDFKIKGKAIQNFNSLISDSCEIKISNVKISILGGLLGIALFYFRNDHRTGKLFQAAYNFILEHIEEINLRSSAYAVIKIKDKFKEYGNDIYTNGIREIRGIHSS